MPSFLFSLGARSHLTPPPLACAIQHAQEGDSRASCFSFSSPLFLFLFFLLRLPLPFLLLLLLLHRRPLQGAIGLRPMLSLSSRPPPPTLPPPFLSLDLCPSVSFVWEKLTRKFCFIKLPLARLLAKLAPHQENSRRIWRAMR